MNAAQTPAPLVIDKYRHVVSAEEVCDFLDTIREVGAVNMFAAAPVIVREFKVKRTDAEALLKYWMRTVGTRATS